MRLDLDGARVDDDCDNCRAVSNPDPLDGDDYGLGDDARGVRLECAT